MHAHDIYSYWCKHLQGRIQDFVKGGSESGACLEGRNYNPSVVSLMQGVWGAQPPRSYGVFDFV